ncbi:MAG: prepilin peptidase [Caldilineae bacterium]|nr:prepilin peptidase [Chloroflexota bacterium]MCB9176474.1 prepilin peptidase [Caldilineae bacterium]
MIATLVGPAAWLSLGAAVAERSGAWAATETLVKLMLTLWMLRISVLDHRTGRIPNALTAPMFLGVGLYRVVVEGLMLQQWSRLWLLPTFAILFGMWMLHFIGGGDAKFLMGLFALFPSLEFLATLAFLLLVIMIPLLALEYRQRGAGPVASLRGLRARLLTGQFLPTQAELQERGRRYAWTFAVPAMAYMWIYWAWPAAPSWWPL